MFKFDPKNMDDFANKLKNIMPESLKSSKEEMQKTLKSGAEGVLQKLDLVSREEYDIQTTLLKKCQERITELEKKIETLNYSSIEWRPISYIDLNKDRSKELVEVLSSLEELDDVQNIFTNANIEDLE